MEFKRCSCSVLIILSLFLSVTASTAAFSQLTESEKQLLGIKKKSATGVVIEATQISSGQFINGKLDPDTITVVFKLDSMPETRFSFSKKFKELDNKLDKAYKTKKPITVNYDYITLLNANIVKKISFK